MAQQAQNRLHVDCRKSISGKLFKYLQAINFGITFYYETQSLGVIIIERVEGEGLNLVTSRATCDTCAQACESTARPARGARGVRGAAGRNAPRACTMPSPITSVHVFVYRVSDRRRCSMHLFTSKLISFDSLRSTLH